MRLVGSHFESTRVSPPLPLLPLKTVAFPVAQLHGGETDDLRDSAHLEWVGAAGSKRRLCISPVAAHRSANSRQPTGPAEPQYLGRSKSTPVCSSHRVSPADLARSQWTQAACNSAHQCNYGEINEGEAPEAIQIKADAEDPRAHCEGRHAASVSRGGVRAIRVPHLWWAEDYTHW